MHTIRIYLALLLLLPPALRGQGLNYIHYNTNNSRLPHDIVYQVRQGSNGYLWILTDDGIMRYDGTEMTEHNDGLESRYVIATDEENGRRWISTWKGGVYVMERGKSRRLPARGDGSFAVSTNGLLVYDSLLIAYNFADYMVFRLDKTRAIVPVSLKLRPDTILWVDPSQKEHYRFLKLPGHRLVAWNKTGVYSVRGEKLRKMQTALLPDDINVSRSGRIYLRKGRNVFRCSDDLRSASLFCRIPVIPHPGELSAFRVLPSGNICLGFSDKRHTLPHSFYLVNRRSGTVFDLAAEVGSRATPADLFVDAEGGMWLSTDGDGLFHIFDQRYRLLAARDYFSEAGVNALAAAGNDNLYIGTKKGVFHYRNGRPALYENTWKHYVFTLFPLRNKHIGAALGGFSVATTLDVQQNVFAAVDNCFVLPHYTLECRFFDAMTCRLLTRNYVPLARFHVPVTVFGAAEDNRRRIWLASASGLYVYDPTKKTIRMLPHKELSRTAINAVVFEKGRGIWIATGKGLFLLPGADLSGSLRCFGEKDGLTNRNIRCLFSDTAHSVWIGTQNGLFHIEKEHLSVFKKRDGLVADDVICMARLNDRELAIGSSKGVSIVPFAARHKSSHARLFVKKIVVDGKRCSATGLAALPHASRISIVYSATTFKYPELLQFRYRLNRHEGWIETPNKTLFFSNLKPGDYRLELSVRKYDSAFSKPVVLRFTILPPWWKSWPFVLGVIGFSALFSGGVFRRQLVRQRRRLRTRQELSELKMKALQAQLNPHFISNALSVIQYYVLTRNELAVNRYLGQFSELTRLFLEVSRKGLIPLATELELLEHYVRLEQLRFEDKILFSVNVSPGTDPLKTCIPGLLIQPFVENSIHHGIVYLPESQPGTVAVEITGEDGFVRITIEDNGIGRSRSDAIRRQSTNAFESRSGTIIRELQEAYNSQPGCSILITTTDKYTPSGEAAGTIVAIRLRLNERLVRDSLHHTPQ